MERLAINELLKWKNKQYRKPLIVEGARQVGKTWLVKEFARQNYKQLAYVNFEEMKILQNLFEQDFNIHRILTAIGAATDVTCTEGETLIFLDEIQAAPHAVTSLKYLQRMRQAIMSSRLALCWVSNCIRGNLFLWVRWNFSLSIQ